MDLNKLNKSTIKNFIKNPTASRLQSLRVPRDLNLSGSKTLPKKIYKPNLNAVRNKNKAEKSRNSAKSKTKIATQEKTKERFVQSMGIFSEGIGPNLNTSVKSENKVNLKDSKTSKKFGLSKLQSYSINNCEKSIIKDLEPSNLKIDKGYSVSDEHLPFVPNTWNEVFLEVKSDVNITTNKLPIEYGCLKDIEHPSVTLWQLPDSFAYNRMKSTDVSLPDMPEGQIGKISVHKSGKFEISIANTNYVLDSTLNSFAEDAVYMTNDTKESFVLDKIKNRFILSPDWSLML